MARAAIMLYMKYDRVRLALAEVAIEMGLKEGTIRNQISDGTFPVPSYLEGRNRWIDARALGEYFDRMYEEAKS